MFLFIAYKLSICGSSSVVEYNLAKVGVAGSNPVGVTKFFYEVKITKFFRKVKITFHFGGLAQLGEHLPYKQGVGGSIPSSSIKNFFTK